MSDMDWGGLAVLPPDETTDTGALDDLMEAPAAATRSIAPPLPVYPPYVGPPDELDPAESWDRDEDTPVAAGPLFAAPARTVVAEAAVWKTEDHPRWPHGSGKRAGEFMRVGEQFVSGGKTWQIAHIVNGRIYAHEASAKYHHVETKSFGVSHEESTGNTVIAGIEHHDTTTVPKGGKTDSQVPIVDPYVDSSTHDPALPIPEGSQLTPEEWARFGKVDQEHYTELMGRFGAHKPGAAKAHVDAAYAAYDQKAGQLVKAGYKQQYGSSSGFSLSIASGGTHGHGGHGIQNTPEMAKLRQECLALQAEHKAAVQWDLYNRTHSPDVLVVHKDGEHGPAWWQQEFIDGSKPVMSGLSQSFAYRRSFFGQHGVMTPLAVRHVLLSSASAQPIPGSTHFPSELEISVQEQMKYDARSLAITASGSGEHALTGSQMSWLEGMTNEPVGGHVLDEFREALKTGAYLPPPPKPASVAMDGASGKTWVDPPDGAAKPEFGDVQLPAVASSDLAPSALPKDLPWVHKSEDGLPEAVTGKDAGVKEGQYFMGLKGTLYWIGHDPGVGGGYPYRIHKIVDGSFNGENWAYKPDMPGYYLDASYEQPKATPDDLPVFAPHEWVQSTESKFIDQFGTGEKFKLEGTSYEVTGKAPGGQTKIKDLESGLTGKINGDYKTTWLVPLGDTETPDQATFMSAPTFSIGEHVIGPDFKGMVTALGGDSDGVEVTPFGGGPDDSKVYGPGSLTSVGPQKPVVGMTFSYVKPDGEPGERVKATVTKVLANGSVQANLKPGKVIIPADEWNAWSVAAFDPGAHQIGEKAKLRDLKPGDKFHGSAGVNTMRPYEVLQQVKPQTGSAKTIVRNLDTGEVSQLSAHKSYPALDPLKADASPMGVDKATPTELAGPGGVGPAWDPAKYEVSGDKATFVGAPEGTYLQNATGIVFHVGPTLGAHVQVTVVDGKGQTLPTGKLIEAHTDAATGWAAMDVLQLKGTPTPDVAPPPDVKPPLDAPATGFDPSAFSEGQLTKIGDMPGGTVFKTTSKKGPAYYKLSDDGTQTTNLLTGKVYGAKPHWKATPLAAAGPDSLVHGSTLKVGDQFRAPGAGTVGEVVSTDGNKMHVKAPGSGDIKGIPVTAIEIGMVHKIVPSDPGNDAEAKLANAEIAHSELTDKLGALEQNQTHVLENGTKVHRVPAGFRVEKSNGALDVVLKTPDAAATRALQVDAAGDPGVYVPSGALPKVSDVVVGNAHTVSPLGTNAQGKTFGELAIGSVFSPGHGGMKYQKISDTEMAAINPDTGAPFDAPNPLQMTADSVPDDLHSEPLTQAHMGAVVSVTAHGHGSMTSVPVAGHVTKVRPSDGAVQVNGGVIWHKPEHVTVHADHLATIAPGDQLHSEDGNTGTFIGWTMQPNGEMGATVDTTGHFDTEVWNPESISGIDHGTGQEQEGVVLADKALTVTPYEQLSKGDLTTVGTLQPGDVFAPVETGPDGAAMKLVDHTGGAPEAPTSVVTAAAGGVQFDSGFSPDHQVYLHAKAADATPVNVPSGPDPQDLPDAVTDGGLVGYSTDGGGPSVFTPVGLMPQGTIFEDAGGHVWKVKQAGATPVISGGSQHFQVDPTIHVKDMAQGTAHPYPDTAGPVGGGHDASLPFAAAQADMVDNPSSVALGDMTVKVGDYFMPGKGYGVGVPHQVTNADDPDGWTLAQNLQTGHVEHFTPSHVPLQVSPGAFVSPPAPNAAVPDSEEPPAPSLYTEPISPSQLHPGQKYTIAPGSPTVHAADGSASHINHAATQATVYVQADDPPPHPPAAAIPMPAAPKVDPATLPPVEGPNGFAPEATVPPLAATLGVGNLDPFTSRKGPGGVYSYPRLSETQVGQLFTDKSGTDYRVIEHGSGTSAYENVGTGEQFLAESTQRVKLTALPPDPGPQLKPVVVDLVHKYASLENVPKIPLVGYASTYQADGKTKNPRLGHLHYGEIAYDANGQKVTFLGSWLDRALVLDHLTNEPRLADAGLRVSKQ